MRVTAPTLPRPDTFSDGLSRYRRDLDRRLASFLADKRRGAAAAAPGSAVLVETLEDLLDRGGKRLRPALVHHAYLALGGPSPERIAPLAMAVELLHTYLLVHDDIMDHAGVRRGRATAHVLFAHRHSAHGWRGDAEDYGRSMAILVGDLAAAYAFELAAAADLPPDRRRAIDRCFFAMTQEVVHGQHLEVLVGFLEEPSAADLERVLRLKSGRYSVEHPVRMGALAAGAGAADLSALARFGAALGEAFQLHDDLLGTFGDSEEVGKPVGSDLAEGKFTFLVHHALAAAAPPERSWLRSVLGRGDLGAQEVERARSLLVRTGAVERVQEMVRRRLAAAREELSGLALAGEGAAFLEGLIDYSRERRR